MIEPLADFAGPADRKEGRAMEELERLSTLEDLRRLMARYVYNADLQRWEELASLFTVGGTFTPHNVDGSVARRMEGRAEISESIPASMGPDAVLVHHLFSYEIDIESASTESGRNLERFTISVEQEVLDDLRARLRPPALRRTPRTTTRGTA